MNNELRELSIAIELLTIKVNSLEMALSREFKSRVWDKVEEELEELEEEMSRDEANGEHWGEVDGFDDVLISSHGRVKRNGNITLGSYNNRTGHYTLAVIRDGKQCIRNVGSLVYEAFGGEKSDYTNRVKHIDGDTTNNHINNLEMNGVMMSVYPGVSCELY